MNIKDTNKRFTGSAAQELDTPIHHGTATIYLLTPDKTHILLLYHQQLQAWIPPGGHIDEGELPQDAAMREVMEETKIEDITILPLDGETVQIKPSDRHQVQLNTDEMLESMEQGIVKPFAIIQEGIPAGEKGPFHYHDDFIYIGHISEEQTVVLNKRESGSHQWIPLSPDSFERLPTFEGVRAILSKLYELKQSSLL